MGTGKPISNDRILEIWESARQAGITRRKFLLLLAAGGAAAVLAACAKTGVLTKTPVVSTAASAVTPSQSGLVAIPGGKFDRGDHHGFVDPGHPTDELPIRTLTISPFYMAKYDVTVSEYCDFLNSAISQGSLSVGAGTYFVTGGSNPIVNVNAGMVYLKDVKDFLILTRPAYRYATIDWDGSKFSIAESRDKHPITGVTWHGAAAYCNWLSQKEGYQACYETTTWGCYYKRNGYRLPTEAEWEYAGRGGQYNPYFNYPWGDDADKNKANWPGSGDPWENGPTPRTTPVGFYNGSLQKKSDFNWPGNMETYQTGNGINAWGLADMAGNVWQWCNDWYRNEYYAECPDTDPPGPDMATGNGAPNGRKYRCLRGGVWYNGEPDKLMPSVNNGHSRVSNRDPAYYLGQEEFNYCEIGFRITRRDYSGPVDANEVPYGRESPQPTPRPVSGGAPPPPPVTSKATTPIK